MDLIKSSEKIVDDAINEVFNKIANRVNPVYTHELANFAKEIFDSAGQDNGRNWHDNVESTIKKKGFNHRNVDSGLLESIITEEGFLMQDNYMEELESIDSGYAFANESGNGANKFDDIGQRESDKEEIMNRTIQNIVENYR
jgi:hypothetical protein